METIKNEHWVIVPFITLVHMFMISVNMVHVTKNV